MAEVVQQEQPKRHRSPNYPNVSLREAIERLKKFYAVDGKAGATPQLAAKHIGFSSAHGTAFSTLAALKKFGLVDDRDGRIAPNSRALEILHLQEIDPRRQQALRDAAMSPPVYRELIERYKETGLPGDETLAGELVAYRGFNPKAVSGFVKDFRETLEFVGLSDFSMVELPKEEPNMEVKQTETKAPVTPPKFYGGGSPSVFDALFPGKPEVRKYPMEISIPRNLKAELAIVGDFKKEDLERLKKQLARLVENLEDAFAD